jgi:hypothetical protein
MLALVYIASATQTHESLEDVEHPDGEPAASQQQHLSPPLNQKE